MGGSFSKISKKNRSSTEIQDASNFHDIFSSSHKSLYKDKVVFDEREHSAHIVVKEIFKGNFSSPIQDILSNPGAKVLDVGCGSGFWVMEMAADFPKSKYVGVDRLPTFPKSTFPNNVQFLQHDFLTGLPYEDNTFDFIHLQFLICEFTELQWRKIVFPELARLIKPGGWLEICDSEFEFKNGGPIATKLNLAVRSNLMSKNVIPTVQQYRSFIKSTPTFSSSAINFEKRNFPCSYQNKLGSLGGSYTLELCKSVMQGPIGKEGMNIKKKDVGSTLNKMKMEFIEYRTYYCIHRYFVQKESSSRHNISESKPVISTREWRG